MNAFILYLWLWRTPHVCTFVPDTGSLRKCVSVLNSPTTYSWATRSLMLQLFPATHVYLPVSSVVTSVITKEPLGIFWNLEERRDGTNEGGGPQDGLHVTRCTLQFLKIHSSVWSEMLKWFSIADKKWMPSWHVSLYYTVSTDDLKPISHTQCAPCKNVFSS